MIAAARENFGGIARAIAPRMNLPFIESHHVSDKHTGNLLRIAAPPGAGRIDFVCDRLRKALAGDARAVLIALDPEIDSYSRRIAEMGGRLLLPGHAAPDVLDSPLACLNCTILRDAPVEAVTAVVEQLEIDNLDEVGGANSRPGLLIVEGCHWMRRLPVSGIADRVRRCVRTWSACGGDVIAIGRSPGDTAFLEPAPVVHMCSKFGEDWVVRAPTSSVSAALRELEARIPA